MSEQVHRQHQTSAPSPAAEPARLERSSAQQHGQDAGLDDLLDSIDAVLETNAEEYVRSFVQKGGQ